MKKLTLIIAFSILSAWLQAQSSIRKTIPVKEEEVPVAVRNAFQVDFGKIPGNGRWTADIRVEVAGAKIIVTPVLYTYSKYKPEKIEVRYLPNGSLSFVRGLSKSNKPLTTDTTSSTRA